MLTMNEGYVNKEKDGSHSTAVGVGAGLNVVVKEGG
jgi:hypothetical protein